MGHQFPFLVTLYPFWVTLYPFWGSLYHFLAILGPFFSKFGSKHLFFEIWVSKDASWRADYGKNNLKVFWAVFRPKNGQKMIFWPIFFKIWVNFFEIWVPKDTSWRTDCVKNNFKKIAIFDLETAKNRVRLLVNNKITTQTIMRGINFAPNLRIFYFGPSGKNQSVRN